MKNTLKTICHHYGISEQDIKSKSRKDKIVKARKMFCYIAREFTNDSSTKIAREILCSHCNVLYHAKDIRNKKLIYQDVKKDIEGILEKMGL